MSTSDRRQPSTVLAPPRSPDPIDDAMRDAVHAVERARATLRSSTDPLAAAVDSALSCATMLMELRRRQGSADEQDVAALRDALGAARALVGEITFAVRDRYRAAPGACSPDQVRNR